MLRKAASLLLLFLFALPALSAAGEPPSAATEFARMAGGTGDAPGALQLAVVTYAPPEGGYTVDLVSAIHIGDREYYQALNERFRAYDALLYELVVPADEVHGGDHVPGADFISRTQIGMKNLLGLSFQLEEIDYTAPNFVHADMTSAMLAQSMADRGESLYVYFWRMLFASIEEYARDPLGLKDWQFLTRSLGAGRGDALKIAVARELVNASRGRDILGGEDGSAIIAARNAHAVDVLEREIAAGHRHIGVFYGVAHMPDFEERLVEQLALRRVATEWIDAWRFSPAGDAAGCDRPGDSPPGCGESAPSH